MVFLLTTFLQHTGTPRKERCVRDKLHRHATFQDNGCRPLTFRTSTSLPSVQYAEKLPEIGRAKIFTLRVRLPAPSSTSR